MTSKQPLQPEGSLKNIELSPTPVGEGEPAVSNTAVGQP